MARMGQSVAATQPKGDSMFKKWIRYVLMDQAGEGGAASGGSAVDGAQGAGAAGAAAGTDGAAGNVLQAAAGAAAPVTIPDKFLVKNDDGSGNHEASSLKLAEAYSQAEKRIGSGDVPPKTASDYAVSVPEALAGAWDPATDPLFGSFRDKAHGLGFTQAQMDLVVSTYGEIAPG